MWNTSIKMQWLGVSWHHPKQRLRLQPVQFHLALSPCSVLSSHCLRWRRPRRPLPTHQQHLTRPIHPWAFWFRPPTSIRPPRWLAPSRMCQCAHLACGCGPAPSSTAQSGRSSCARTHSRSLRQGPGPLLHHLALDRILTGRLPRMCTFLS